MFIFLRVIFDRLEEGLICFLLFCMTSLTFANVVVRYVFNSNILWVLEATVYMFAWLVLLGSSYGVKKNLYIGVDVLINYVSDFWRYIFALFASFLCIIFSLLLLFGSWSYWYPFVTERAWLEVNDIPMLDILRFFEGWLNEGESYEKMPRFIPYAVLPLSMFLLTVRFCVAAFEIAFHRRVGLIVAHEVTELSGSDVDRVNS